MSFVTGLRCVCCGAVYPGRGPMTCPRCGITGILDVEYDYRAVGRRLTRRALERREDFTQWRYRELLPISGRARLPGVAVGWSPLRPAPALARDVGVRSLLLKDDGRNPSASLKDRASAVGAVKALEARAPVITCASTGNAASSLAGMAASLGLKAIIFVPERAPEPKLAQMLIFGATVLRVRGSYAEAWELCQQSCERWGWYNRNCAVNPYLVEGKKTVSLEICEQLACPGKVDRAGEIRIRERDVAHHLAVTRLYGSLKESHRCADSAVQPCVRKIDATSDARSGEVQTEVNLLSAQVQISQALTIEDVAVSDIL